VSKQYLVSLVLLLALIGGFGWQKSLAQTGGEEYFEETGHWVRGKFLIKYRSVPNPLQLYGYPITDLFLDPTSNLVVQYFQKARFELHPEAPADQRVQLSPLGEYMYRGTPAPAKKSSPACRNFQGGLQVCYDFLKFYLSNGGEEQFGQPLSNWERHNNLFVQYFQKARFEWYQGQPDGQPVLLGNLGMEYFTFIGENPIRLRSKPGNNIADGILSLKVRAYPARAVTPRNGTQTIYVVVQDQRLFPVEEADVSITIKMPSGEELRYIFPTQTNKNGVTQFMFPFATDTIGIVKIEVTANSGLLESNTTTSFRVWW